MNNVNFMAKLLKPAGNDVIVEPKRTSAPDQFERNSKLAASESGNRFGGNRRCHRRGHRNDLDACIRQTSNLLRGDVTDAIRANLMWKTVENLQ